MHATPPNRPALRARPASRMRRQNRRSSSRGIALIEVLVAMLIFLLGVLGLMGMQGSLTRTQTDSKLRADAAYLASEVVGRMWSDVNNLTGYAGEDSCEAAGCTEWRSKVAKIMPGGGAAITVDEASGDVSVTVTWAMPGGDTHKYVTRTTITAKTAG